MFLPSQSSSLLTSFHSLSITFLFACCLSLLSHKGALSNTLLISNSTSIIKTATSRARGAGKNGLGESFSWLTLAACADKVKQVSAVLTYIQLHGDILGAGWRLLALVSRTRKPAFVVRAAYHKFDSEPIHRLRYLIRRLFRSYLSWKHRPHMTI